MPRPPRPPKQAPPITGTAAQRDAARDATLRSLLERVERLEQDDDERTERAAALRTRRTTP